jgi:cell division protein FtsI (penicillin-binding protein 3)
VTLNGVKMYGGVVAAPVFKNVATETLRLMAVPKDIPEVEPPPMTDPQEADDLSIADLSTPPEDLVQLPPPPAVAPTPAPAPGAVQQALAAPTVVAVGPSAPSFQGKTVRAVIEQSLAAGVPVEVVGSGIARQQVPAPGSPLNAGEKVRVLFQ